MLDLLITLAIVVLVLVSGRTILSLLPPGDPGAQRGSPFPLTWSVACTLGFLMVTTTAMAAGVGTTLNDLPAGQEWVAVAPLPVWLVIAILRWKSLPGAMVPRHDVAESPTSVGARALFAVAWILLLVDVVRAALGHDAGGAASMALWFGPMLHSLRVMRVQVEGRALVTVGVALLFTFYGHPYLSKLAGVLLLGPPIVMGGLLWTRRADRRGRAVALFVTGACLTSGHLPTTTGIAIVAGLVLASLRGSAWSTAKLAAITLALSLVLRHFIAEPDWILEPLDPQIQGRVVVLSLGVLVIAAIRLFRTHRPPVRDVVWLVSVPVLAYVLGILGLPIDGDAGHWSIIAVPFLFVLAEFTLLPQDPLARTPKPE
jgi:hypothetical protein